LGAAENPRGAGFRARVRFYPTRGSVPRLLCSARTRVALSCPRLAWLPPRASVPPAVSRVRACSRRVAAPLVSNSSLSHALLPTPASFGSRLLHGRVRVHAPPPAGDPLSAHGRDVRAARALCARPSPRRPPSGSTRCTPPRRPQSPRAVRSGALLAGGAAAQGSGRTAGLGSRHKARLRPCCGRWLGTARTSVVRSRRRR
jgi:hypothetical protein